ncbi:hypothetical protein E8E13_006661 [Curvularia kusanoi]|uniref:Uncharacterized protein n=1 Tax=Curvularia kusanoi TaxID=90978 RepID=A0A9P4T9G2_CURKU|nr:hypothetical protein E8E13_006661 [Curvularia kusanoi]
MVSLANKSIRGRLETYPDSSWGFVIYRCTYSCDSEWDKYMAVLNAHVRAQLEPEELSDCFDRINWNVQEGPKYDGMDDHEVRVEFQKWIASGEEVNDG